MVAAPPAKANAVGCQQPLATVEELVDELVLLDRLLLLEPPELDPELLPDEPEPEPGSDRFELDPADELGFPPPLLGLPPVRPPPVPPPARTGCNVAPPVGESAAGSVSVGTAPGVGTVVGGHVVGAAGTTGGTGPGSTAGEGGGADTGRGVELFDEPHPARVNAMAAAPTARLRRAMRTVGKGATMAAHDRRESLDSLRSVVFGAQRRVVGGQRG